MSEQDQNNPLLYQTKMGTGSTNMHEKYDILLVEYLKTVKPLWLNCTCNQATSSKVSVCITKGWQHTCTQKLLLLYFAGVPLEVFVMPEGTEVFPQQV